jgi:hypothetical protein
MNHESWRSTSRFIHKDVLQRQNATFRAKASKSLRLASVCLEHQSQKCRVCGGKRRHAECFGQLVL